MIDEQKNHVFILSSDKLNNQFLGYTISHELAIPVTIYNGPFEDFSDGLQHSPVGTNSQHNLYLIDCLSIDIDSIFSSLVYNPSFSHGFLAMYNLKGFSDVEGKALTKKVRGFFYIDDKIELFLKGITTILSGEVWISRELLLKYVMQSNNISQSAPESCSKLSLREREILLLVSNGYSNEEISHKLYISINTVRTHMYHIFKKLKVSNRLQAAIWATKHL